MAVEHAIEVSFEIFMVACLWWHTVQRIVESKSRSVDYRPNLVDDFILFGRLGVLSN